MKTKILFLYIYLLFVLLISSCSTEKQAYLSNYHIGWKNSTYNLNKPNLVKNDVEKQHQLVNSTNESQSNSQTFGNGDESQISEYSTNIENDKVVEIEVFPPSSSFKNQNSNVEISNINTSTPEDSIKEYDVLVLKNGAEIKVKVLEISEDVVKVKRFSDLNGPTITIEKSKVKQIRYANGTFEDFKIVKKTTIDSTTTDEETNTTLKAKVHPLALVGFIFSLFSLIAMFLSPILGLLFGLPAIILSIIALAAINKNPNKWGGKGFAIAGIAIPIVALLLIIALIAFIIFFYWGGI